MSNFVQWNEVPSNDGGKDGTKADFLKMESGKSYRIRPLFNPVRFWKYFHRKDNRLRTAICENPDTCPVKDNHPELKKPSLRYAAYIIDRSDGKVKVLEAPQAVFRPIFNYAEASKKNPGDIKEGSDWQIKVSGAGLKTKYDVAYLDTTPLTKEEAVKIKEALNGDKNKLQSVFPTDSPESIEKKLFGDFGKDSEETVDEGIDSSDSVADSSKETAGDSDFNF